MADEQKYNRIKELQNENNNLENYDYKEIVKANKTIKLIDIINFSMFSFSTLFALPKTIDFVSAVLIALGAGFVAKSGFKLYRINREKRNLKSQNNVTILENNKEIDELKKQIINKLSKVDALDADENLNPVEVRMIDIRNFIKNMPIEYQIDYLNTLNNIFQLYEDRKRMSIVDNDKIANEYLDVLEINITLIIKTTNENNERTEKIKNNFACLKRVRKI